VVAALVVLLASSAPVRAENQPSQAPAFDAAGPGDPQPPGPIERWKEPRFSDEVYGLQVDLVPEHIPGPYLSAGPPFFHPGKITEGFEIPTGAIWQPQFFVFGTFQTGIQTFDDGEQDVSQWVNRLDVYANLNLTPTERVLLGFRPLDEDGEFSGFQFNPDEGGLDAVNGRVRTFFFEGKISSLFPNLERRFGNWTNAYYSIGRQELVVQGGQMIDDTIDLIGLTRPTIYALGGNRATVRTVFGWNYLNRGNNQRQDASMLLGLFGTINYTETIVDLDAAVVTGSQAGGTGLYLGGSARQTLGEWLNTTFRANGSVALDRSSDAVNTGLLLFAELATNPSRTRNVLYLNGFWGFQHFTSAARDFDAGGPLGQTGILFAATGLGDFGPALDDSAVRSIGAALGYQMFFDALRQQLVLEAGTRVRTTSPTGAQGAVGFQWEQALLQNFVWTVGGSYTVQESIPNGWGLRSSLTVQF